MRLSKFLQVMAIGTALVLVYVHMQMRIFDLAYRGKVKEKQIVSLREATSMLTYDILKLQSSSNLGIKLLTENSGLQFGDQANIVHLVTAEPVRTAQQERAGTPGELAASWLNFIPFRSQAEAQAADRTPAKLLPKAR